MYVVDVSYKGNLETIVYLHMVKSGGISVHTAFNNSGYKIHANMRHLGIDYLPEKFKHLKRVGLVRSPIDWYMSFYNFFSQVRGFFSWMLYDLDSKGVLKLISFDEFIRRSKNLKFTFLEYPFKLVIFVKILKLQQNMHFINSYFKEYPTISDIDTLQQFDMSLYDWFYINTGLDTANTYSMDDISLFEKDFGVKLPVSNVTKNKVITTINTPTKNKIMKITKTYNYEIKNTN